MRRTLIACLLALLLVLPSIALATTIDGSHRSVTPAVDPAVAFVARMVDPKEDVLGSSLDGDAATLGRESGSLTLSDRVDGNLDVVSLAGSDRFETAVLVSQRTYPSGAEGVIITNGYNWPDAMSGAALAGMATAPILLTPASALPRSVLDEIDRLGATSAIILGGTAAVSSAVEQELVQRLGSDGVMRIEGRDRYETSAEIAQLVFDVQEYLFGDHTRTSFVATGLDFPDALGASSLSAARWFPIVLVNPAGIGSASIAALKRGATDSAILLGGTGALPSETAAAIASATGQEPLRLWGADRYETAREVAEWGVAALGLNWETLAVATGRNFPDALAGSALQGRYSSVMLLTPGDALPETVLEALTDNAEAIWEVRYLGGTGVVCQDVRDQIEAILQKDGVPWGGSGDPGVLWQPSVDLPATGGYVYLDSDVGDYIGQGLEYLYTSANASITVEGSDGRLTVGVDGDEWWYGRFAVPDSLGTLEVGSYPNVTRYPFHDPMVGGLSWSGEGRGLNTLTGWFVIDSVEYEGAALKSVELRFQQRPDSAGEVPSLHGAIRWTAGG